MMNIKTKSMYEKNNKLYLGNYSLEELANKYKTPLYVFDEAHLRAKLDIFKQYFKSDKFACRTVYASKAFYCPYLSNIIKEYGFMMDSVSHGDLYMFKKANFDFKDVVLHGNNKDEDEIRYALVNDIGIYVLDNEEELDDVIRIANELSLRVNMILRLNPGIEAHTHEYIQTSLLSSKFGESIYDLDKIERIVKKAKECKFINFRGFHCHIGSSINQVKSFEDATVTMLKFLKEIEDRCKCEFDILNLGGGFGIKYVDGDKDIDLKTMLSTIVTTVEKFLEDNKMALSELLIEPGRSIVGDSGFTLYTSGGIKHTFGGKDYLFVDGGMTDNIRPALYNASYTVYNASKVEGENIKVDVVGPCCESGDIVAKDVMIPYSNKKDIIAAMCTGAYGYSMSSNYNGRLRGSVIFVNEDKINEGIRREEFKDLTINFNNEREVRFFDCHSDMLFDLWQKKIHGVKDEFTNFHVNQLETSQIHGSIWTMYSEFDFDLVDACKIALKEIKMDKLSDFEVILGLEGLRNLKEVEDIDILYNMGFRHAMLTWNEENKYATGAKSDPTHGLKEDGVRLLKRMEELGMIIDLAHTNEKSFYDILKVVNKNIIYSHGLCKALCDHPRNLTDDQMKALKAVDGLFGITLAGSFIAKEREERTVENFMKHIKHAIDIMGIDNVCFGFDFMDYLDAFANSNIDAVPDATKTNVIVEGLRKMGLSEDDIDKITWKNFYDRYKHLVVMKGSKK